MDMLPGGGLVVLLILALGSVVPLIITRAILRYIFLKQTDEASDRVRIRLQRSFCLAADVGLFFSFLTFSYVFLAWKKMVDPVLSISITRVLLLSGILFVASCFVYWRARPWPGIGLWLLLWVSEIVILFPITGHVEEFQVSLAIAFGVYLIWLYVAAKKFLSELGRNNEVTLN